MALLKPCVFAGLKMTSRMVRSATYEKMADEDGHVTDEMVALYRALARGGSGLIITGPALVHPSGRYFRKMLSVHSDLRTGGLSTLASAVHEEGGLVALQLDHGGRQCPALVLGGEPALAPSGMPCPVTASPVRAMDDHEIWAMVDAFASAAYRARSAGFDALELQAASGYLISSFLSPHTNRRDDYWGGDGLRRTHFMEETLRAMRKAVGDDYPIVVKLNATDHLLKGGVEVEDAIYNARAAVDAGASIMEVSGGMRESDPAMLPPADMEGWYLEAAHRVRSELSVPVIATGGFLGLSAMEAAMDGGKADMIGLSRPLIRQPDLPRLMREEGLKRAECTHCQGCMKFSRLRHVHCVELDK